MPQVTMTLSNGPASAQPRAGRNAAQNIQLDRGLGADLVSALRRPMARDPSSERNARAAGRRHQIDDGIRTEEGHAGNLRQDTGPIAKRYQPNLFGANKYFDRPLRHARNEGEIAQRTKRASRSRRGGEDYCVADEPAKFRVDRQTIEGRGARYLHHP